MLVKLLALTKLRIRGKESNSIKRTLGDHRFSKEIRWTRYQRKCDNMTVLNKK